MKERVLNQQLFRTSTTMGVLATVGASNGNEVMPGARKYETIGDKRVV